MCRADTIDSDTMQMLKDTGLQRVFLGIESFNQAQLERFRKNISVRRNIRALIAHFYVLYRPDRRTRVRDRCCLTY